MYFNKQYPVNHILELIKPKLEAVLNNPKNKLGVKIDIKAMSKNRTIPQNSYMWAVYDHIVKFCETTGFIPDSLPVRFVNSDFLHAYFKSRFNVPTTTKLSTIEIMEYCDSIQLLMTEQSFGEYEPIYPEERFQEF